MTRDSAKEEYPQIKAILLCREVSISAGLDGLLSLSNVFENINVKGDAPLSTRNMNLPLWIYVALETAKPEGEYNLTIEVYSPGGEKVLEVPMLLENPFLSPHSSGAVNLVAVIKQEGNYLIDIKFQNRTIGKRTLSVNRI